MGRVAAGQDRGLFTEAGGAQECTGISSSGHGRKELLAEPLGSPRAGRAKGVTGQDRGVLAEPAEPRTAVTGVSRSLALTGVCGGRACLALSEMLLLLLLEFSLSH